MRFVVDALPEQKGNCPFSEWRPYPPCIEETGYFLCRMRKGKRNAECDLDVEKGTCRFLVEMRKVRTENA